jgi:hypothetical protein
MKRVSLVLTLALVGLMVAAPATLAAPPTSPFAGTWYSHDPAPDNSLLQLDISGGAKPQITFTDYFGSVCVNLGSPVTVFTAFLTGVVDGNTLDATFVSARCGPVRIGTGTTTTEPLFPATTPSGMASIPGLVSPEGGTPGLSVSLPRPSDGSHRLVSALTAVR